MKNRRKTTHDGQPMPRTLPGPRTQSRRILVRFAKGERLDHADWYSVTGAWRLAAHIGKLRNEHGWAVKRLDVLAPTPECPSRTIALYFLDPEDIPAAREALRMDAAQRPR